MAKKVVKGNKQATAVKHGESKPAGRQRVQPLLAVLLGGAALLGVLNLLSPAIPSSHAAASAPSPLSAEEAAAFSAEHMGSKEQPEQVGNVTYMPSFGTFPRGCKWREVHDRSGPKNNITIQYLDEGRQQWGYEQPAACSVRALPARPAGWRFGNDTPRTEVDVHKTHILYHNLWYNAGRWYALVDGPKHVRSWKWSKNQEIVTLHVDDARAWVASLNWRPVPGDSLLFDFIYFMHPTAIGHWWEMMGPLFSVLRQIAFKRPCDNFVLLHLRRQHLMEWVRAVMAVALGVGGRGDLPRLLLQQDVKVEPWRQLALPLEGSDPNEWLVFERMLVIRDLATGGVRTFHSTEDAQEFRKLMYRQYGLPPPARRPQVPRRITFQRKRANRRVVNEEPFLQLLGNYGEVQVVEFNASYSLYEQLLVMRDTGVFISVHTSNLANSLFLQPGSAVVELIQRHWSWNKLDTSFKDQTQRMGDIHHYAWRANRANESVYVNPADTRKFADWAKEECYVEECVEAATEVDVVVDLHALKALLDDRLPLVFAGKPVAAADIPWPPAL